MARVFREKLYRVMWLLVCAMCVLVKWMRFQFLETLKIRINDSHMNSKRVNDVWPLTSHKSQTDHYFNLCSLQMVRNAIQLMFACWCLAALVLFGFFFSLSRSFVSCPCSLCCLGTAVAFNHLAMHTLTLNNAYWNRSETRQMSNLLFRLFECAAIGKT